MTKQEIIYDIITILTKGNYTDDSLVNETYIGYKVDEKRAKEIHDSYKRNLMIDPKWIQDYGVVNTTEINEADDKSFNYLDCKLSKITLPPTVYIHNPIASVNSLGVYSIRSVDSKQEFYYKPPSQLMELYRLSNDHTAKKFKYYSQIGNSLYFPDAPEKIRPLLILEKPLDGYVLTTENIESGKLVIGEEYEVMSDQIVHNNLGYIKGKKFTAINSEFTGIGKVQFSNQKRRMTVEDEYPMSSTMAEVIILKLLTQEFKLTSQQITDIRNDSKDSLKVLQPIEN